MTSPDQTFTGSFTVLVMQGEISHVKHQNCTQPLLSGEIALGVNSLARQTFMHTPPLPMELERAIELTEDVVMPLAAQFVGNNDLFLQGSGASLIAEHLAAAGIANTMLSLEEVEAIFNRMVAVSGGRPASQEPLAIDARFVAAVVMLREFMHHLRFTRVTLQQA